MKKPAARQAMREELLAGWRGGPEALDLSANIRTPDDLLEAILKSAGIGEGIGEEEIRELWRELAGDFISRHAEPFSVRNGNLILRVTQPAMRFHLEQMKPLLLRRIRERLGDRIVTVNFTLG